MLIYTILSFIAVISIIVFVHEFGHYIVAKLCGVRVEEFSIGFGKELFGFNDRSGTRWKVSALPLGGYVKMFGDASGASNPDALALENMSEAERKQSFHYKPLWQKSLVVLAGPVFNILLTIAIFTWLIFHNGLPTTEPIVGEILKDSPAEIAGIKTGDRIIMVGEKNISRFNDIVLEVALNTSKNLHVTLLRDGKTVEVDLPTKMRDDVDGLGNKVERPIIGIRSKKIISSEVGVGRSLVEAVYQTEQIITSSFRAMGQMLTGERSTRELKGAVGMAKLSGQAAEKGIGTMIWLIAMISANLGVVNILPIPPLDGGHLLYYTIHALRGKPLAEKAQEYGYRFGMALVMSLMAFTIFNDIRNLF